MCVSETLQAAQQPVEVRIMVLGVSGDRTAVVLLQDHVWKH